MLPYYAPPIDAWAAQVEKLIRGYGYNLRDNATEATIRCFLLPKIPNEYLHLLPDPPRVDQVLTALKAVGVKTSSPFVALQADFHIEQQPSLTYAHIKKTLRDTMDPATPDEALGALAWSRLVQLLPREVAMSDAVTSVNRFPDPDALTKLDRTYLLAQTYQSGRNAQRRVDNQPRYVNAIASGSPNNAFVDDSQPVSESLMQLVQKQQQEIEELSRQLGELRSSKEPTSKGNSTTACATAPDPQPSDNIARSQQQPQYTRGYQQQPSGQRPRFNGTNYGRPSAPRFPQPSTSYGQQRFSAPQQSQREWMCPAHYAYGPAAYTCQPRCVFYKDFVRLGMASAAQSLAPTSYQQTTPSNNAQPRYQVLQRPRGPGNFHQEN